MDPTQMKQVRYTLGVLSVVYLVFFFGYIIKITIDRSSASPMLTEARPLTSQEAKQRTKERLEDVKYRYNLTSDQVVKLGVLLEDVNQNGKNGTERRKMTHTAMETVLTPEQRVLFEQRSSNQGVERPGGTAGPGGALPDSAPPGGPPPGYRITPELQQEINAIRSKMNPDQQERLDQLIEKMKRYRYPVRQGNAARFRP